MHNDTVKKICLPAGYKRASEEKDYLYPSGDTVSAAPERVHRYYSADFDVPLRNPPEQPFVIRLSTRVEENRKSAIPRSL